MKNKTINKKIVKKKRIKSTKTIEKIKRAVQSNGLENELKEFSIKLIDSAKNEAHGIITNPKQRCRIIKKAYTYHRELTTLGFIKATPVYNVYVIEFGAGNYPKLLITPPHTELPLGRAKLNLKPASEDCVFFKRHPDMGILSGIYTNDLKLGKTIERKNTLKELKREQKKFKIVLELGQQIGDKLIEKIDAWEQDDFDKLVELYLTEGLKKDTTITYIFRAHLVQWTYGEILPPKRIMPFKPHTFLFTGTSTGKSWLCDKVTRGKKYQSFSPARAMGFSTAEITSTGSLDGNHHAFSVDEFEKGESEKLLSQFTDLIENGEVLIGKGREETRTCTTATMVLNGNPSDYIIRGDDHTEYQKDLDKILENSFGTNNVSAIGKRFGVFCYGLGFRTIRGKLLPIEFIDLIDATMEYILDSITPKVESLLLAQEIQTWIKQKIALYKEANESILKGSFFEQRIERFVTGHLKEGHQHVRGFAFAQAIMDHLRDIYHANGETLSKLVPKIIESADEHLKRIAHINLESIRRLCDDIIGEEELLKGDYDSMPIWLKAFVNAVGYYYESPKNSERREVTHNQLGKFWNDLDKNKKEEFTTYLHWSNIGQQLKSGKKINNKAKNLVNFGIKIRLSGTVLIVKADEKFLNFFSYLRNLKNGKNQDFSQTNSPHKEFRDSVDLKSFEGVGKFSDKEATPRK